MRSPMGNKLTQVRSAQNLAPSNSQKTLGQQTSPNGAKKSDLFDERGNLIGAEKEYFGHLLKQYTENKQ